MDENNMSTFEEFESTGAMEVYNEPETSSGGFFGKLVIGTLVAGAAAAAVVYHKTKDKREAKKIEKLRAKGYKIEAPNTIDESQLLKDDHFEKQK